MELNRIDWWSVSYLYVYTQMYIKYKELWYGILGKRLASVELDRWGRSQSQWPTTCDFHDYSWLQCIIQYALSSVQ